MSVSAAKCLCDGLKKKRPDSQMHTVFVKRHMLRTSAVLLPPHGKFKVNARDSERNGRILFLATFDTVLHRLVIAGILVGLFMQNFVIFLRVL